MKRILLIATTLLFGLNVGAQSPIKKTNVKLTGKLAEPMKVEKFKPATGSEPRSTAPGTRNSSGASASGVGVEVGITYYDLQSNSAVARRIINHGDGTISVVWTMASSSFPASGKCFSLRLLG